MTLYRNHRGINFFWLAADRTADRRAIMSFASGGKGAPRFRETANLEKVVRRSIAEIWAGLNFPRLTWSNVQPDLSL